MNKHFKLKTGNGDTVWGVVSFGEGTRAAAQLIQTIKSANFRSQNTGTDFWLLSFKVLLLHLHDLFASPKVQF